MSNRARKMLAICGADLNNNNNNKRKLKKKPLDESPAQLDCTIPHWFSKEIQSATNTSPNSEDWLANDRNLLVSPTEDSIVNQHLAGLTSTPVAAVPSRDKDVVEGQSAVKRKLFEEVTTINLLDASGVTATSSLVEVVDRGDSDVNRIDESSNQETGILLHVYSSPEDKAGVSGVDYVSMENSDGSSMLIIPLENELSDASTEVARDVESSVNSPPVTVRNDQNTTTLNLEIIDEVPASSGRTRKDAPKDSHTRKRSRNDALWKANVAKKACNMGESYVNVRGQERSAKKLKNGCTSCRFKCSSTVSESERLAIFKQFWKLADHTRQWDFICMHVKGKETQQKTTNWKSNRKYSYQYFFIVNGCEIRVCQKMFLKTLDISEMMVRTALRKKKTTFSPDKRGRHSNKFCRIKGSTMESIMEHINMFERVPSHYCRKDSNKEYLPEGLNIRVMHGYYLNFMKEKQKNLDDDAEDDNRSKEVLKVATERQYRDVVNTKLNIAFFTPRKDQCDQCVKWKLSSPEKQVEIKMEYEKHMSNKEAARNLKDSEKSEALTTPSICLASFDLQKVLNAPHGQTGSFYYVSKVSVYNFTVFDIGKSQGYCYCWHESVAKRGVNEIGSCMKDFIEQKVKDGVTEFKLYSDNCAGQNKNRYIYALWHLLAILYKVVITHRFLEVGHTQTEGDSIHALIERKSKHLTIYTPQEWFTLIKVVKDGSKPYIVKEITQEHVFNLKDLLGKQNWLKDTNGEKVLWNDIREVTVDGNSQGLVKFRYDYSSPLKSLSLHPRGRPVNLEKYRFSRAYHQELPVSRKKKDGLIQLCNKGLIPADRQNFFEALKTEEAAAEDEENEED